MKVIIDSLSTKLRGVAARIGRASWADVIELVTQIEQLVRNSDEQIDRRAGAGAVLNPTLR